MSDRSGEPRLTMPTMKVLRAYCEDPKAELTGWDVGLSVKLGSGTVYPILARLERAGWLSARWEDVAPEDVGRPRRRYYRVTALGYQRTQDALQSLSPQPLGALAWNG